MQLKYTKDASFNSNGMSFTKDSIHIIDDELAKLYLEQFPSLFEVVESAKETKTEVKSESDVSNVDSKKPVKKLTK